MAVLIDLFLADLTWQVATGRWLEAGRAVVTLHEPCYSATIDFLTPVPV